MGNQTVAELKKKSDAAWEHLSRQLQGMEPYIDRSDAPGEWTTREVLSHLLFEAGFEPSAFLRTFPDFAPRVQKIARSAPMLNPSGSNIAPWS